MVSLESNTESTALPEQTETTARIVDFHPDTIGASPVSREEFAQLMNKLNVQTGIGMVVAVSGGADSLALALLAHEWFPERNRGRQFIAVTIDHGLRPESTAEAEQVQKWCIMRGIRHEIITLQWPEGKPTQNKLMAAARDKRYEALVQLCARTRKGYIITAHQKDDQAETFLIRFARASGIDGLACMAPSASLTPGVTLLRPFLSTPRERLKATLQARAQAWVEDPTNDNREYMRTRIRNALARHQDNVAGSEEEGLRRPPLFAIRDAVYQTVLHMQQRRDDINQAATAYMVESLRLVEKFGYAFFNAGDKFRLLAPEVATRVISRTVMTIGGRKYPPSLEHLLRLYKRIMAENGLETGTTIGGCKLDPFVRDRRVLIVCREEQCPSGTENEFKKLASTPLEFGKQTAWDGRFRVKVEWNHSYSPNAEPRTQAHAQTQTGAQAQAQVQVQTQVPAAASAAAADAIDTIPIPIPIPTPAPDSEVSPLEESQPEPQAATPSPSLKDSPDSVLPKVGSNIVVRQLKDTDWVAMVKAKPYLKRNRACPLHCRTGLPVFEDEYGILGIPHYNWFRRPILYMHVLWSPRHDLIPHSCYVYAPTSKKASSKKDNLKSLRRDTR